MAGRPPANECFALKALFESRLPAGIKGKNPIERMAMISDARLQWWCCCSS